jgi:hypothetical protein
MKVGTPSKKDDGSVSRLVEFEHDGDWMSIHKDAKSFYQGRDQHRSHHWTIKIDGDTLVVSGTNVKVVAR